MAVVQSARELVVVGCTGQHIGDRKEQQDRVSVLRSRSSPRCVLGVLADGMSGRSGGRVAAENVVLTTQRAFDEFNAGHDRVEEFFRGLIWEIHTVLKLTGLAAGLEPHSTFAAVLLQPHRVDWCHVGDSRIYHTRGGQLMHCTSDHTYAMQLIRSEQVPVHLARRHPSAHCLVNALGAIENPTPELGALESPQVGDSFLLCSDGLWNYFDSSELVATIDRGHAREAAEALITGARDRARGRGDNCSLVLFKFEEPA